MKPVITIIGPTATGKSDLAIRLAMEFGGEVISGDSRQVYRSMDIGTAKLTPEEQVIVPHHLIDIKNADEPFSLAEFQQAVYALIDAIQRRGKIPFIAGGTGQYVWSVLEGWVIPKVEPDMELRGLLEQRAAEGEAQELYRELQESDPAAAESIDPRNVRRVIRALEVVKQTGQPFSGQRKKNPPDFDSLIIGLTADRAELYRRIDLRVDSMIEHGLVGEVKNLLDSGFSPELPAMSSIGYRQIVAYLNGDIELEEAVRQIKTETHRLVRRQYNWFSLNDERINWLDITDDYVDEAGGLVKRFLVKE